MDNEPFNRLVSTFFTCRRDDLIEIFTELLDAIEAESHLQPGGVMSRNYETAQANPEIHTIPGNLKDARDAIFPFFWGTDGWASDLHIENVKGPASYASLVGAIACLLKNPNLCVDTYCQRSNELEVKAITALANLIFYHTESPWGVFTMGGTISNLYGGKIGIEKTCPGAMQEGLAKHSVVGFVSDAAHYSNATLAGWLGMGTNQLWKIPTDESISLRLDLFEQRLEEAYRDGHKVAFAIGTFGTTDAYGVDDIAGMREILESVSRKYSQPTPHLHVDAAVGWVSCFLSEYNVDTNPLGLSPEIHSKVQRTQQATKGFRHADSVTIDFHKMGWGHYPSSAFIVNRREDLKYLLRNKEEAPYFCEADYRHDPALFTLECSRPAIGPYAVMASLNGIGLQGYQMLVGHAIELATKLKERIEQLDNCKVLNDETFGPSVVWWVLPKGRDAKSIYQQILAGTLSDQQCTRYFAEVRRMFEKRQQTMKQGKDPLLSFTTSMGFKPHGRELPAWKGVFFSPRTRMEHVDAIIASIEDLV